MMDSLVFLTIALFYVLIATCLLAGVVFLIRGILRHRGLVSRSLNQKLLVVRFASHLEQTEQNLQQLREKIALMEQFYSHLYTIHDNWLYSFFYGDLTFALELTVPATSEELSFYLAVPRMTVVSVQKMIQGVFPEAVVEETRDYNIFNPHGATAAALVTLTKNSYYPIKNYTKLEGDPLKALSNAFTKLTREGEGAALQIIARPAKTKWQRKLKEHAKKLYAGERPNARDDAVGKAFSAIDSMISATSSNKQKEEEKKEPKKLTPMEEEVVRALEGKAGKALFETNVRVIASARDLIRAREILTGLESAFSQFADPSLNRFTLVPVSGASLQKAIFQFSFRSFNETRKVILDSAELTSIYHFPNVPLETPKMSEVKARQAPPPPNLPEAGLLLGHNEFRSERTNIYMQDDDRRRHMYIIGQTGTGKSSLIKFMAKQDVENGKGICVIDPHGDLVNDILSYVPRHRYQDVVYFNPGDVERPMGLNFLEYDPRFPEQKTFIVNELLGIFNKLFNMSVAGGPMFEQYFRNATQLIMEDPASGNTILDIARVMSDKEYRAMKLSRAKNIVVKKFWTEIAEKASGESSLQNMVPYIVSKTDTFTSNDIMRPIIAQEKSAFNFRDIMDNQKILLVNLSKGRLGDLNSSLIGLIVVGKLLMSALSRVDTDENKRKDFYLYIDEFQNVTTDSIATILSEARKYRLDLIIAHQFIGQLQEDIKKAVFGNVGSMTCFRIGSDDAEFVARQYKPIFAEQDLMKIANLNAYMKLLIGGETSQPFSMKVDFPEKGNPEAAEIIKEISRLKYGRPREEVEEEVIARHSKPLV